MVNFTIDIEKTLELGLILKKERERLNLTTQEVSKKTSISTTDINYIEWIGYTKLDKKEVV